MKPQEYQDKLKRPDEVTKTNEGALKVKDKTWRTVHFGAMGKPSFDYCPIKNLYLDKGGNVLSDEDVIKSELRWDYSQVDAKTGEDALPPTPDNISKMRRMLIQEATEEGELPVMDKVIQMTTPHTLPPSKPVRDRLDVPTPDERMLRRIMASNK